MNDPRDDDHGHDQTHDFGDVQLSAIYQQSRKEEPAMRIDSAILAEARRAVVKKAKWWRASWIAPIATISVAVLAVTIGMLNKSMVEKQEAFVEPATDTMPMENRLKERLASEPEAMPEKARDAEKKTLLGNAPAKRQAPSAPAASGAAQPASEGMEQESAPVTAPSMMKRSAPKMERRSREALAPEPQQFADEPDAEMDQAKPMAADEQLEPEAWLEKIRQLKADGRDDEAARELELFGKAYPDYELPDDLK